MSDRGDMKVELKAYTDVSDILEFVGNVAGVCTGKSGVNDEKRALRCIEQGHMSVLEHMTFTWYIQGISRACTHQLVRHRMASYNQESQRYVKMKEDMEDWFIVPQTVKEAGCTESFKGGCGRCLDIYLDMMNAGVPAEDARYILPNATKSNIWVTMNLRELLHFYELRTDRHAQWEIRDLAERMIYAAEVAFPEMDDICKKAMFNE